MEKKQFIQDLKAKEDVQSVFLIKYMAIMEGKDGKSYLNVILLDNSGELEARKWHGAEKIVQSLQVGDYANIKGKVNQFQGRLQLIIEEMYKADSTVLNLDDYTPKSSEAPDKMMNELLQIVNDLEEVYIRDLLLAILNDPEINRRLKIWQAGKSIHHAYRSGLLEHILSCTNLAVVLSKHYAVNTSYVVAGTVMHDICKIYELTEGPVVDYTEEGKLIGHLVKGLELIDHFAFKIKNFPHNQKMHIKHILLSHHGEYEYGSPKIPHTSEAYLVHLIDMMDSKMNAMVQVKNNDNNVGNWSSMIKHLDRVVYKKSLPSFKHYVSEETETTEEKPVPAKESSRKETAFGNLLKDFKIDK